MFFNKLSVIYGCCVVAAQQTLTLLVEVRFLSPVPYKNTLSQCAEPYLILMLEPSMKLGRCDFISVFLYDKNLESNAAGMVRRPALKTGFSEMGWGSTPLLSANL